MGVTGLELKNRSNGKKIVVVEDDEDLRNTIIDTLSTEDYHPLGAGSVKEFKKLVAGEQIDLAIVDINLPDGSGNAIVRMLANTPARTIVLTGRDAVADRVEGYNSGADIYMVKPTSEAELIAAASALLRRVEAEHSATQRPKSSWRLEAETGTLHAPNGGLIRLNMRETAFMERLMQTPGKVVERDELRRLVSLQDFPSGGRALDMFIARLRRRIEKDAEGIAPIVTVPRKGFAFQPR